jgi:hypothetical protein
MPSIRLEAATLPAAPCGFLTEQERLEAFVAAMRAYFIGGIQWQTSASVPADLEAYWLKTDADGRPIGYRVHVAADGRYAPPLDCTYNCVAAGDGDDITISNSIKFTAAMAFRTGMKFRFVAPGTNTGPVTLKIDDQDPKDVIKNGGEDLAAGDIIEDQIVEVVYNATVGYFEIVSTVVTPTPVQPTRTTGTGGVPAAGGTTSVPHGGSTFPDKVEVVFKCTEADRGYSVDDEVNIEGAFWTGSNTAVPALTVHRTASTVGIVRSSTVDNISIAPKGGGAAYGGSVYLTPSKWQIKVRCEFWPV